MWSVKVQSISISLVVSTYLVVYILNHMQNISMYIVACQAPINKSTTVESCRIFIIIVVFLMQV